MKKIGTFFSRGMLGVYAVLLLVINFLVLFFQQTTDYACKKEFALPDIILLFIGLLLLTGLLYLFRKKKDNIETFFSTKKWLIWIFTGMLLALQIFFCWQIFFVTKGDPYTLLRNAEKISIFDYSTEVHYFSRHTNNVFLLYVFSCIFKVMHFLGEYTWEKDVFAIIVCQCVISSATGFFLYQTALLKWKSYAYAFLAWLFYVIYVGFSPWIVITYSDSIGLFIPTFTLWLYQVWQGRKHRWIFWFLMGLCAYAGYRIKPQTVIIIIAIVLVEIFKKRNLTKRMLCSFAVYACSMALAITVGMAFYQKVVIPGVHMDLNTEADFGMAHYLMLGMNEKTNGVYNQEDAGFSISFETKAERNAANLAEARERIAQMQGSGFLIHLAKKTLVNFADGTFAWGGGSDWYQEIYEMPNQPLGTSLRNIYYNDGKYFAVFVNGMQMIWLVILFGMMAAAFNQKNRIESDKILLVMMTAVVGLILFETTFEAKAKYLYTYAPIFIFLAMTGYRNMISQMIRRNAHDAFTD